MVATHFYGYSNLTKKYSFKIVVIGGILYYNFSMEINDYANLIQSDYAEEFEKFKELLLSGNEKFNLTAITDDNGIFNKHFLDSVIGEQFLKDGATVCEVGSGGGFPSVPLKIIRPDLHFLLIESTGKKCTYLQEVVDKLNFSDTKVMCVRAEDLGKDKEYREKYDCCVARAVAKLNSLCEYCLPLVKKGGVFIAYKGDCDDEVKEAQTAVKVLGGKIENIMKYCLLNGEKRTLIVIKKVENTPQKYPRGNGKERKCPIK